MENKECPCRRKNCERHGKCDLCRKYHAEAGSRYPVACEKPEKKKSASKL